MVAEPRRASSALIGKAGVGLVMFHLGRLGYDFMQTTDNSRHGDLWVMFGDTPEPLEVKTAHCVYWPLKLNQAERVKHFAFVSIEEGECWLIHADAVREHLDSRSFRSISRRHLKTMGARPLHQGLASPCPRPLSAEELEAQGAQLRWRTVKARLADGTIREYRYPRGQIGHGKRLEKGVN